MAARITFRPSGQSYSIVGTLQEPTSKYSIMLLLAVPLNPPRSACRPPSKGQRPPCYRVVIKVINLEPSHDTAMLSEHEAMQRLSADPSPHVVQLLDSMVDRQNGRLLLVMPYINGGDLFDRVSRASVNTGRSLPLQEVRSYFTDTARGLLHLKKHDIAHGDVSLENVMLSKDGVQGEPRSAHVIDFGSSYNTRNTTATTNSQHRNPAVTTTSTTTTTTTTTTTRESLCAACRGSGSCCCIPTCAVGPWSHIHSTEPPSPTVRASCATTAATPPTDAVSAACVCTHTVVTPPTTTITTDTAPHVPSTPCRACTVGSEGVPSVASARIHRYKYRGKPSYIPPECVCDGAVAAAAGVADGAEPLSAGLDPFAVDIYGLGVCLYVMLTGFPLYSGPQDCAFQLVTEGRADFLMDHYASLGLPVLDPSVKELVCSMVTATPERRPTLEQVLAHEWCLR